MFLWMDCNAIFVLYVLIFPTGFSSVCVFFPSLTIQLLSAHSPPFKVAEIQRVTVFTLYPEISPECSLEGLMLKLKLQSFGYLMKGTDSWKRPWRWERLRAGGEGDDRGWDGWMASPTQWTWVWVNWSWWWTGRPGLLRLMGSQRVRHDWAT